LTSEVIASARPVSLIRTTAASRFSGPATVFVRTVVSYCSNTQCFEQRFGEATRRSSVSV